MGLEVSVVAGSCEGTERFQHRACVSGVLVLENRVKDGAKNGQHITRQANDEYGTRGVDVKM